MTFTVITITLNAAACLQRSIDSVLKQSRLPDEYIFVDGGSSDETLAIIDRAMWKMQVLGVTGRLVHQVHQAGKAGIPEAWNQGLAVATGDIIALLNSDDFYSPKTIETVCQAFSQPPAPDMVTSPIHLVREDLSILKILYPKCLCLLPLLMPLPHPGTFISRALYQKIGFYNENYSISADYDLIWRAHKGKASIAYLPTPLVSMQIGGLANSSRALARQETLRIATSHTKLNPLPYLAWLARKILNR